MGCRSNVGGGSVQGGPFRGGHTEGLLALLNSKRAEGLPLLQTTVTWEQKGPLARSDTQVPRNRHFDKFRDCGWQCFELLRTYYAQDFDVLQYPDSVGALGTQVLGHAAY